MQEDGNLVVYRPGGTPIWASNTGGAIANYVLILQKDRNVVIYGPAKWATNTNILGKGVIISRLDANNSTVDPMSGGSVVVAGPAVSNGTKDPDSPIAKEEDKFFVGAVVIAGTRGDDHHCHLAGATCGTALAASPKRKETQERFQFLSWNKRTRGGRRRPNGSVPVRVRSGQV
ncbi:mannose-specific lectin [Cinnamomum micranthum f. kanehirae]|uniref:Mannose-specific lectin n=1 Tax=Cinnamomum micranthum f. kanehirae TaxID=337451 RepID=A0A443PBP6_9MAGN|nr:mannose-specific lectin [Cinnamomum micranthum f. kanehirae]